jgi:hypothetical protein
MFPSFATSVVDSGGKFATCVVDNGGSLPPLSLTPAANFAAYTSGTSGKN